MGVLVIELFVLLTLDIVGDVLDNNNEGENDAPTPNNSKSDIITCRSNINLTTIIL